MDKVDGVSHGYPRDIDLEDAHLVVEVIRRHREGDLPGPTIFDEILDTLLRETSELRAELKSRTVTPQKTSPSLGWAERVMKSQIQLQEEQLASLGEQRAAVELEKTPLQREAEALKDELVALFSDRYHATCPLEEQFIPPTFESKEIKLSEEQRDNPLERLTAEYYQLTRVINHEKALIDYYTELPNYVKELREALSLAKEGRWDELVDEPQVPDVQEDTGVKNLETQLIQANDTIASQKLEMREMQAQIDLLKRQLAGANYALENQALSSLK